VLLVLFSLAAANWTRASPPHNAAVRASSLRLMF
jgi:hypothetical protein